MESEKFEPVLSLLDDSPFYLTGGTRLAVGFWQVIGRTRAFGVCTSRVDERFLLNRTVRFCIKWIVFIA